MTAGRQIFVISDATGETADRVIRAALLQFADVSVDVRVFARIRAIDDLRAAVAKAAERQALVVFTLVSPLFSETLIQICEHAQVEYVDLIGALMSKLTRFLSLAPKGEPGLMHRIGEEYFRRIEAVEFTVRNDDGRAPESLSRADLVLVGVSRTSKTPLSTFLAQKGYRVANVPLILGHEPPRELFEMNQERIFALVIEAETLVQIRRARLHSMGVSETAAYAKPQAIAEELTFARRLYAQHPKWPVINMTGRAVEETAADILQIYHERFGLEHIRST